MIRDIIIWGTGRYYDKLTVYLRECIIRKEIHIIALVSSYEEAFQFLEGIPVIKPERINEYNFDYLIVASDFEKEIIKEAINYVEAKKIICGSITESNYFDFYRYFKIRESNMSIVSDSCWGGFVYHLLGMEFTSPLINTYILEEDFLRLISDIRYWFRFPLKEKTLKSPSETYPIGILEDEKGKKVEIKFFHDNDFTEVIEKWKRRLERFNYDNYLVQMNVMNEEAAIRFSEFHSEGLVKKVGFSPSEFGIGGGGDRLFERME